MKLIEQLKVLDDDYPDMHGDLVLELLREYRAAAELLNKALETYDDHSGVWVDIHEWLERNGVKQ